MSRRMSSPDGFSGTCRLAAAFRPGMRALSLVFAIPPRITGGCPVRPYPVSACLVCRQIPILPGFTRGGRIEAPARSAASQARTTDGGRLNPRASTSGPLGRGARMAAAGAERPCGARQACRGYGYGGKGERAARGHLPPPRRGSYRALDALGLRRGAGYSPGWRKERSRRSPPGASNADEECYTGSCSYLVESG